MVGRGFALTSTEPEDDSLLVEGMILVYSTFEYMFCLLMVQLILSFLHLVLMH